MLDQEFVDQVPLGTHDLHAVVAGLPGQVRGVGEVFNGAFDVARGQFPRRHLVDRGAKGRRSHGVLVHRVAARMHELQGDEAPGLVHGGGDHTVTGQLVLGAEVGAVTTRRALRIGGDATGDDEARTASHTLHVEGREFVLTAVRFLESCVH